MNPSFVLITISTPNIENFSLATEATKKRYCERHGYILAAYSEKLDGRPASWSKVLALLECFERYQADWFFCLDADAMILNPEVRLQDLVDQRADLIISHDLNGLHAGSFLIHRNPRTVEFLRNVYSRTAFIDHYWWEQAAISEVLYRGESQLTVRYLPQRTLNAYLGETETSTYQPGDFVLHLPGMSLEERVLRVNRTLLGRDFSSRAELPQIITAQCGAHPVGAEVGVFRGDFSEYLLSHVAFSAFHCIDTEATPWKRH